MGDFHALRRLWQIVDRQVADRNIQYLVVAFNEKVMMIGDVGVEIGLGAFDGEHADQARLGKLMQRVVDSRERNRNARGDGFLVKLFYGQMAIPLGEEKIAERDALPGRPQAHIAQPALDRDFGFFRHSGTPDS